MPRRWYEVRVREQIAPNRWVKKSKFYKTNGPRDAAQKYKGSGTIMWVNKVHKEQALGVGSFFNLGGDLLEDLRNISEGASGNGNGKKPRSNYNRRRKEALK